jgi:hypothetical protein
MKQAAASNAESGKEKDNESIAASQERATAAGRDSHSAHFQGKSIRESSLIAMTNNIESYHISAFSLLTSSSRYFEDDSRVVHATRSLSTAETIATTWDIVKRASFYQKSAALQSPLLPTTNEPGRSKSVLALSEKIYYIAIDFNEVFFCISFLMTF